MYPSIIIVCLINGICVPTHIAEEAYKGYREILKAAPFSDDVSENRDSSWD